MIRHATFAALAALLAAPASDLRADAAAFLERCGEAGASAERAARFCGLALREGGLSDAQRAGAAINLGAAMLDLGNAYEAERAYSIALDAAPRQPLAREGRAKARSALGNARGAAEDWARAVELAPRDPVIRAGRGAFRLERGDARGALEDFEAGLERARDDPGLARNRALALAALGRGDEAVAAFDREIRRHPRDARLRADRGRAKLADDPAGALADFERAAELSPGWATAHRLRGLALDALGRRDAADDAHRRAWELGMRSADLEERVLEIGR